MSGGKFRFYRTALLILVLVFICQTASAALSYPFYTTTKDSVRLRKSPSSRALVLENLFSGEEIEVLGSSGNYFHVKAEGKTGYVMKEFVNTDEGSIHTPAPETEETVTGYPYPSITRESVNLRETKSLSAKVLKKIPSGAEIMVLSNSGTWAEIEYDAIVGYVKNAYIVLKKVVKSTPTPTPAPTLSPEEEEASYAVLEMGIEGTDVKALQEALQELGFLTGAADGKYGEATRNAVILFQQANDYPMTGVADANLQAFLYSGKPKNSSGNPTKVKTVSPVGGVAMREGNIGDAVGTLQARLLALGYYDGNVSRVYDSATKKAVTAFQKKYGLTADGVAGKETLDLLYAEGALAAGSAATPTATPTPTPVPVFTIPSGKVQRGTEGNDAKLVQQRLKDLGYYRGRVDGKFGGQSVLALRKFQEANGLKADGIAGEDTYKILFSLGALSNGATATPAPGEASTPAPGIESVNLTTETAAPNGAASVTFETLRQGAKGDAVKLMQEALINLNYLSGTSDGNFGSATVQAVKTFQKENGLKADGIAGNATLSLLYSADAKPAQATPTPSLTPTATPAPSASATPTAGASARNAAATPTASVGALRKGSTGDAVRALQERLIALGYLTGKADGKFGTKTHEALVAFQRANRLTADGIAGVKTQNVLSSSNAASAGKTAAATAAATATAQASASVGTITTPSASKVIYANWYTTVKAVAKKYPYCTIYDYQTGISWQIHIFSVGAHADYEPLTANDTAKMEKVFGGNTWNPRAVWVIFADGSVYMASTHSKPHEVQHITDNNFPGHSCLHFPRTQEQVEAIGSYATSHQQTIDSGWAYTQSKR